MLRPSDIPMIGGTAMNANRKASTMRRNLMDILVCPVTKSALTLEVTREENGDVLDGTLSCEEGHVFPIEDGIPNMLPPNIRDQIDTDSSPEDETS